ncbi:MULTISPECIES: hypothetical protein [unclassified Polyangium]|nr:MULTISPECIES: hypothetical protein [unclassified Polyangium]MDI1444289.1 hypothetical protein [Polyangium sp. 6x1]MDI3287926.1 hypothetical protein [Polyangium sp. 15x6]
MISILRTIEKLDLSRVDLPAALVRLLDPSEYASANVSEALA